MEVQLHGVESRLFQLEKKEGGEEEECSQEKRMEASWLGEAKEVDRRVGRRVRIKNDKEEGEGRKEEKRICLELGIDICLNFQNFLLGFASLVFAASLSKNYYFLACIELKRKYVWCLGPCLVMQSKVQTNPKESIQ